MSEKDGVTVLEIQIDDNTLELIEQAVKDTNTTVEQYVLQLIEEQMKLYPSNDNPVKQKSVEP